MPSARSFALFKSGQLEVMRVVLPAGKAFPPHRVAGEITVQCLEGRIDFSVDGVSQELRAGQLLHLEGGVLHGLVGLEDGRRWSPSCSARPEPPRGRAPFFLSHRARITAESSGRTNRRPSHDEEEREMKQYGAEFIGTFWLVLGGCGSAVIAAAFPSVGIGLLASRSPSASPC